MLHIWNPIEKGTLRSGGLILARLAAFGMIADAIGWSCARARGSDLGFVNPRWLAAQLLSDD